MDSSGGDATRCSCSHLWQQVTLLRFPEMMLRQLLLKRYKLLTKVYSESSAPTAGDADVADLLTCYTSTVTTPYIMMTVMVSWSSD